VEEERRIKSRQKWRITKP